MTTHLSSPESTLRLHVWDIFSCVIFFIQILRVDAEAISQHTFQFHCADQCLKSVIPGKVLLTILCLVQWRVCRICTLLPRVPWDAHCSHVHTPSSRQMLSFDVCNRAMLGVYSGTEGRAAVVDLRDTSVRVSIAVPHHNQYRSTLPLHLSLFFFSFFLSLSLALSLP